MKLSFKKLPMIVVIMSLLVSALNVQPVSSKAYRKPDRSARVASVLIVQVKAGFTLEEDPNGSSGRKFKTESPALNAALKTLDVQSVKPLIPPGQFRKNDSTEEAGMTRIYRLRFKKSADIDAAMAVLSTIADIEFAEPDYVATAESDDEPEPTETPTSTETPPPADIPPVNDPRYSEQWALPAIDASSAWAELPFDAPKLTVAVVDSGICADHPDLAGRILDGWDFLDGDALPQDEYGHGCAVAGIIAANMNNEMGMAGVAPNAQIMPLRVLNETGSGSYSDVAAAIVYSADNGAQIVNLSLGGSNPSTTLENAINYAISKGVIVVASAGNSGTEGAIYPAAYPDVIAVGSVDPNLEHSSFSNYGSQVDIWAPGRDILATNLDGGYEAVSGTSFAAPYVAGAEALEMARGRTVVLNSSLLSLSDVEPPATATRLPVTPVPTQLPTIAPTTIPGVDPASAGSGSIYRAQIRLKQPMDEARLQDWNVTVLQQGNGAAVVQVTPEQLSKLARLGFEPTQIDSVSYMLAVTSFITGNVLSLSDVTSSAADMMALASVDTDSDGLTDTEEAWWCTNPNDSNSDSPEAPTSTNPKDGTEVNNILRGITAYGPPFALWPQFTPHNPNGNCPDGDFDGAPDYAEEFMIGTSNLRESSDKDKFDDGQELFGVTYCPASSGPCGYGILPRAEDAAFVSANLPAWVKAPGSSPLVAAFPLPRVEVVPSSLKMTQVTTITHTNGTTVGTEKTYGSSTTTGTSTSHSDTVTWNEWSEVSISKPQINSSVQSLASAVQAQNPLVAIFAVLSAVETVLSLNDRAKGLFRTPEELDVSGYINLDPYGPITIPKDAMDQLRETNCAITGYGGSSDPTCKNFGAGLSLSSPNQSLDLQRVFAPGELSLNGSGNLIYKPIQKAQSETPSIFFQPVIRVSGPAPVPTRTETTGKEWGGSRTDTHSQYEEQTISQSSTNQTSDTWSTAVAVDSSHAADLRFTYNIVNNGTEYAREVTSLTFNVYIGNEPNPAYTYVAVGVTGQIDKIENFFPGDSLTYTSDPIALTLDEMRAIDEGAPVRVVMEDISFGQDQVFYLDALNGSVTLAMEDGYDDLNQTLDTYLVPVWSPTDTLQDVVKRYFPTIEDSDGNLLAIFTPESKSNIPARCEQDTNIAPASNTEVFCKHALTGTSWWNIYLSDGLNYDGVFSNTLAQPNTSVLVRIVSDRDLDGYNDRNEIRIGTDPDDAASHPSPNLIAGYTTSCTGNDCTVRMVLQNLGNYDAYGVESVMYSPDGLATITNNTIGGSGRVPAGEKIIVGPSDTFQYTKSADSAEPVIVVSYNDPQGNHRFILPSGNYPTGAKITALDDVITALDGFMLADPGVDISSTSSNQAGFVINSPHPVAITNGKLFVEYIDGNGTVLHEDVTTQNFDSGPTVVPQMINLGTYPPETTILLAFFTDSAGNIIDSSARPLASFGADPSPEANITVDNWQIGAQSIVSVPDPWDLGSFEPGTTLNVRLYLTNTGLGDLRYSLTGLGSGWSIAGNSAGTLGPTQQNIFELSFDSAGMTPQTINHPLYLRTNDPANGTVTINLQATIGAPAGTASAYQVSPYQPWNQFVYVPGPHSQNDIVNFTHTLADDPSRMFPLYLYNESGSTLKGVGEYGVDFSGQTAPFGVFGTGADGDLTVTSGQTIYTDNTRSAVSATANSAQSNISLSSATGFAAGQEVLVIQVQGTGAGVYEFANIASVASNTLTLTKNLMNIYTVGGNSKAQVIRVMQYHDVTVQGGGVLTAHAWDGNTGGIVAIRSSGSTVINGQINVFAIGYQGGKGGTWNPNNPGGGYGESYSGTFQTARNQENTNSSTNGGAGGGGIGRFGGGDGRGGGGGSYGTSGVTAPNSGGPAGSVYGQPELASTIYLGSAGGGGGKAPQNTPNSLGGDGGKGGGIVMVFSRTFDSTVGSINANGGSGGSCTNSADESGGGGGGSGGSILIKSQTTNIGTTKLTAAGGGAGNGCKAFENGGAGGSGRIRVEYGSLAGTANPSASTQQVNYYSITGQGAPFGVFGNGTDGDLTVTSGQTIYIDNVRSALASTASSGQSSITVSSATGFAVGKEVLIIQSQGTGAGAYEFAAITNVSGNILTLSKPLGSTYTTGGNSKAQLLVVPQYLGVTIQSGGVLIAHNWDGNTGGIVAFRASGVVTVNGSITASSIGFRGGSGIMHGVNGSIAYSGEGTLGT